jgi:hypothetical protein
MSEGRKKASEHREQMHPSANGMVTDLHAFINLKARVVVETGNKSTHKLSI